MKWLLLLTIPLAISAGQLMFKYTATQIESDSRSFAFFLNPWFICALTIYALATVGWVWVLRKVDLNKAYPFMAIAYIFVPVGSWLIFRESVSLKYAFGIILILAGIVLTQQV